MGKTPRLETQVIQILKSKATFGQSKHDAKLKELKRLESLKYKESENNIKKDNLSVSATNIQLEGIYSYNTFDTYKKKSIQFVKWLEKEHPDVKFIKDSHCFIFEYLTHLEQDIHLAPTSLAGHGSALAKLSGKPASSFNFNFPQKSKHDILKGRSVQKWTESIEENYSDEITVLENIGLRRHEAVRLKTSQISNNFKIIKNVKGKNGKIRDVEVLNSALLKEYVEKHQNENDRLFKTLPKQLNVQAKRREYVQNFYEKEITKVFLDYFPIYEESRKMCILDENGKTHYLFYYPRNADKTIDKSNYYYKPALALISKNLGHNRLEIVVRNYLK